MGGFLDGLGNSGGKTTDFDWFGGLGRKMETFDEMGIDNVQISSSVDKGSD